MESVYIHIPFCKKICSYCDFCKILYNEEIVCDYIDALNNEVSCNYEGEKFKTIYIGGGTPSSLSIKQLKQLFLITNKLNLMDEYEFTIEANISDISDSFLKLCKNNKVNRISIGIETVNSKFYSFLNRKNDYDEVLEKINLAKKYFKNINVDLMYGFYNETIDDLYRDLELLKIIDVPHISIYSLIIEKNTLLYIKNTKRIDDLVESKMYYYIIDYLKSIGYIHYEISNFSKPGYESIHNLTYWNNEKYYGFGLGASGYTFNFRYQNTKSINNYINGEYILEKEIIDEKTKMSEEMICGLRKIKGVSKSSFKNKFNKDIKSVFEVDNLISNKMLSEEGDYIFIPEDKLYISNSILVNFIL